MKLMFKKLLVNILVLMVVMLPLRNVFALSMEMAPSHCATDSNDAMSMMNHAGHQMPMPDQADTGHGQKKMACACCQQCDGDCTGCIHISSAIIFSFLTFTDLRAIESVAISADSLLTRTTSPPSRPPLVL